MRLIGIFSIAAFVALTLQTTIPRILPMGVLMPDLTLILAVNLGLRYHTMAAVLMAFGIGYATDAFSGNQLGLNALLFTLIFVLTYWLARGLFSNGAGVGAIAVFAAVILRALGGIVLTSGRIALSPNLMPMLLIQAAVTTMCAPVIFSMTARATRIAGLPLRTARD